MKIIGILIVAVIILILFALSLGSWQIQNSSSVVSDCEGLGYFASIKCDVSSK